MPRPEVTLTFDNGPEPGVTQHVLEVLKKEKILATFPAEARQLQHAESRQIEAAERGFGHTMRANYE